MPPNGPTPPDVPALTRAIASGDREALGGFFGVWFDRVYGLARVISGRDEAFCLDVCQEVMVKVARHMKPLPDDAALAAWVAKATRSAVASCAREESRRRAREAGPERRAIQRREIESHTLDRPENIELLAWVRREFDALPETDRVLLRARVGGDATLEQAAAGVGVTGDAAHGRVRRSLDRLRRAAEEWLA